MKFKIGTIVMHKQDRWRSLRLIGIIVPKVCSKCTFNNSNNCKLSDKENRFFVWYFNTSDCCCHNHDYTKLKEYNEV